MADIAAQDEEPLYEVSRWMYPMQRARSPVHSTELYMKNNVEEISFRALAIKAM
jgi:hypothetical protein